MSALPHPRPKEDTMLANLLVAPAHLDLPTYCVNDVIRELDVVDGVYSPYTGNLLMTGPVIVSYAVDRDVPVFYGWVCSYCKHRFWGEDCGCNTDSCRQCNNEEVTRNCAQGWHEHLEANGDCCYCGVNPAQEGREDAWYECKVTTGHDFFDVNFEACDTCYQCGFKQ